jgi:hypothetical protein
MAKESKKQKQIPIHAMKKKVKQTVIPANVVKMAKFIQECDQKKQSFVIMQGRCAGRDFAVRLARNNN